MTYKQPPTARPQLSPTLQPIKSTVAATVHDHRIAPESGDDDVRGLISGLSALNPTLVKLGEQYMGAQRDETVEKYRAHAYKEEAPRDALTNNAPVTVPDDVPPAFSEVYINGFKLVRTQRAALEVANGVEQEYLNTRDLPGFNAEGFLKEQRQKAMAGLTDPTQVELMGRHMDELSSKIMSADTNLRVKRHEEERESTMAQLTSTAFKPDMLIEDMHQKATWLIEQGAAIQVQPQETAKALLRRLKSISAEAGGKPELFDVFDRPDSTGRSLRNLAPSLSEEIDAARGAAKSARDRSLMEATMVNRFSVLTALDKLVDEAPEKITPDLLIPHIGKFGISEEKAAAYLDRARDNVANKRLTSEATSAFHTGMLGRYEPSVQQKVLEAQLGPALDATWRAFTDKSGKVSPQVQQESMQHLAEQIMQAHSQARATVPAEPLVRMVSSLVTNLPDAEGPTPGFTAVAELYKALSANPQYRDMYFKGDAEDLMRTYTTLTKDMGLDPKTAYSKAYLANTPEEKERHLAKAKDPEFAKEVHAVSLKAVEGSSMFRMWGLMNGRPENADEVAGWASWRIKEFWRANPHLNQDAVVEKVQRMVRENWIMDGESQQAIRVPAGQSSALAQEAFTDYTKELKGRLSATGMFPEGSYIKYAKVGDEGTYRVEIWNGSMVNLIEPEKPLTLDRIVNRYKLKTNLQRDEALQVKSVLHSLRNGMPADLPDPVLTKKAANAGMLTKGDLALLSAQRRKATFEGTSKLWPLGDPEGSNTLEGRRGTLAIDPKLTAKTAIDLAMASHITPNHLDLAASLVATREGVALKAYQDPAKGAGANIGAGYNLTANAATVDADLTSVGVPKERLQDVKTGKASLTPGQVKQLISIAVGRIEPQVQKVAESVKPGLWSSLAPQQRAVMVDIAYQAGPNGAAQYVKAWQALATGDKAAFGRELKTYYTDKTSGRKVEDVRALDLRSSMLLGPSAWKARLMVSSKQ